MKKFFYGMVIFCLLSGLYLAQAQMVTGFTREDFFSIPATEGNIRFAVNGTYSQAKLENNTWVFSDLKLVTSPTTLRHLQVSVQNSNITITGYGRFTSLESGGILRYNITGQGSQTFNFNLEPRAREWSVIFDGEFTPQGRGWYLSNDETITITRQTTNITIFFMTFPEDVAENSSVPFYQRHSATIATGAAVAIIVIIAIIVRVKSQKTAKPEGSK